MRKRILLVDDNMTNLSTGKIALQDVYQVSTVPSGEKALLLLQKVKPDLILLDVDMPEMDGYETIKRIKANPLVSQVPVIFLTAKSDTESELDGLSLGAVDYITKPFSVPLLHKRIELHLRLQDYSDNLQKMVDEKTEKIQKLQDAILCTFAELVEFRDGTTGGHIERTQLYLKALVRNMMDENIYAEESSDWDIPLLVQSAQLHDVGKISIPDGILNKPGKLTSEEYENMKRHTTLGKEAIDRISEKVDESEFLLQAAILAYSHHERWDGSGYPLGLKSNEIPLQGRLMSIADVYDALISERPYKKPFSHEEAVKIITEGEGSQFDPILVRIFFGIADEFYSISKGDSSC